ncbi:MAG TPA: class I adenylate-forming enzyme family protein [Myxococcales bacterium]
MTAILDEDSCARRCAAVVARLAALGLHAGDRVAALAGNGSAFVAARDAATAAELVLVPVNPRLAPAEIAWIAGHARPRALLVDAEHRGAAPAGVPLVELDDALAPAIPLDHARTGATLLYTSGTTGRPKGCWRTAEQERARADELRSSYRITSADTHLIVCPLAHSAPGIFLRAARAAGARTVIAPRFSPESFVDDVRRHRASLVFLVPTQAHRLLALEPPHLDSLRAVIVAGAPFPPAQKAAFAAWLGPGRLYEFYGSSETGTVSVIGPEEHAAHPGSVGRPPAGVSVRVHDGELFVRSPAVMSGYLTEAGDALAPLEARDGHVSVGDLGSIDPGGWITLVDRKHDTIITGGLNVHPAEVERTLAALPEVAGAIVFGVPDDDWGQIVAAVIAPRGAGRPDASALRLALRGRLAGYKLPRAFAFCAPDELPVGSSGKALRRAARAAFAARLVRIA